MVGRAKGKFRKMNEFIRKAVRFIDKEAGTNIESSVKKVLDKLYRMIDKIT
jgi:hypothetical protein